MTTLTIDANRLQSAVTLERSEGKTVTLNFPAAGGSINLPEIPQTRERYLVFTLELLEDHSGAFELHFHENGGGWAENAAGQPDGQAAEGGKFLFRFGVLPRVPALLCFDLNLLDASILFPGSTPGALKVVCHGGRVERERLSEIYFASRKNVGEQRVRISDMRLTDERPAEFPLPERKLADEFGQNAEKDWPGKIHSEEELRAALQGDAGEAPSSWDQYGGWKDRKLAEGTGFFTKVYQEGRWWIADPEGNAFFSMGVDCVNVRSDSRVDGVEDLLAWLPDGDDPQWCELFMLRPTMGPMDPRERTVLFSYTGANLQRVYGNDWRSGWAGQMTRALRSGGWNTIGNWSDLKTLDGTGMPYVASLPEFPATAIRIFRDFPDVFAQEYREEAERCAQRLLERRDDPLMIGYFLRNEPNWAFVDDLVLADEVLRCPEPTASRRELIAFLEERYGSIDELNAAWQRNFPSFASLEEPILDASRFSKQALEDQREFSRRLMRAYVGIPSEACRAVDPNHMILGMRWAWISNPDLVAGWENFDVFSINCYAVDPTSALDNVVSFGVDLPIMIGEFHFGALDRGPTATGLEAVRTQVDRAKAIRYYTERTAAHKYGVGCHYFQCYDQFALGRFDGENYNIGLFDICSQAYPELMGASRACADGLEAVAAGEAAPTEEKAAGIPMIAY